MAVVAVGGFAAVASLIAALWSWSRTLSAPVLFTYVSPEARLASAAAE